MTDDTGKPLADSTSIEGFLRDVPGAGRVTRVKLQKAGFETVGDLRKAPRAELLDIETFGPATVEKLLNYCREASDSASLNESEVEEDSEIDQQGLEIVCEELPTVGRVTRVNLEQAGYRTIADLRSASCQELTEVRTIGRTKATQIKECVSSLQDAEATSLPEENRTERMDSSKNRDHTFAEEVEQESANQTILERIEEEVDLSE